VGEEGLKAEKGGEEPILLRGINSNNLTRKDTLGFGFV